MIAGSETPVDAGAPAGDARPEGAREPEPTHPFGLPSSNLGWSALRNTAAQITGRILVAAARLVVVALIVRAFGKGTFAEYAILIGILTLAEWLVDFGSSDVFVREICADPSKAGRLLRILTAWKGLQIPAAILFTALLLVAMRLSDRVVEAGLVAAISLVFHAGVVVYRVLFRATLAMEREMVAEIASALVMIAAIAVAASFDGGLFSVVAAHLISRAVFFGLCFLLGRRQHGLQVGGVRWADMWWTFSSTGAIGSNGFLAAAYVAADVLLLSRLAGLEDVAFYSSAQRFILPVLMIQASVGGTLYSIAASKWSQSREEFGAACRRGLEAAVIIAGGAICSLGVGAPFFMGLLGPELLPGSTALRILSLQTFFAAVPSTIGLVLYVVRGQAYVLRFIVTTLLAKVVLYLAFAPRFGFVAAAMIALGLEVAGAVFGVVMLRRITSVRIRWNVPVKVAMICLAVGAAIVPSGLDPLPSALLASTAYVSLLFLTRTLVLGEIYALLPRKVASS